jgi:glycerate kinase
MTFCGAALRPGFDCVAEVLGLGEKVRRADLVVTGEGGMDAQTLEGKAPAGLAALARRHGVPVVAIAGTLADDERLAAHFDALAALVPGPMTVERACERADELLAAASVRLARALAVKLG